MDFAVSSDISKKLQTIEYRKSILQEIASWENKERKYESFKQFECYHERCRQFVLEYLRQQFSKETVNQMPIVDSVNVSKRIVSKQASLYCKPPKRDFTNISAEQAEELRDLYEELGFNIKMKMSNAYFKLQDQATLWAMPVQGKLKLRNLLPHQFDVIPNEEDPEIADAYIINSFDRSFFFRPDDKGTDGVNQKIADKDDWRENDRKFLVFTREFNFIMNGKGEVISDYKKTEVWPFVDIAKSKDLEFFVRGGRSLTDFAIQFCGALSDMYNIVKMQGWAVGWFKAPSNMMPENIVVGPNVLLRLPMDPNNPQLDPQFGFSSPNADIAGSIQFIETLVALFLTSRGLDAKAISTQLTATNYSSGLERLLAMLDQFHASADDFKCYIKAEKELFEIIKKWSNLLNGEEKLLSFAIPESCQLNIQFTEPEMVQTESEKFDLTDKKYKSGYMTRVEAVSCVRGVSEEKAEEIIEKVDEERAEMRKKQMASIESPEGDEQNEGAEATQKENE